MQTSDLVGKLVLFKFSEHIRSDLPLFQIYKDEIWAVVTGVENEGIWIQNSAYELGIWWDENGNLVPQDEQTPEKLKSNIFIPWRFIKALMSLEDERFQRVKDQRMPGFKAYKG